MARLVSLSELLARLRQVADVEHAEDRFPEDELVGYINAARAELHEFLVNSCEDYATNPTPYTITTTANTDAYDLPSDFFRVRAVHVSLGGVLMPLHPWRLEELAQYQYAGGWFLDAPIAYHRMLDQVVFRPIPSGPYTITLHYAFSSPKFYSPDDTINGENGWEEFIVYRAGSMVLEKDDRDPSLLNGKAEMHKQRVLGSVQMVVGEPPRVLRRRLPRARVRGWR